MKASIKKHLAMLLAAILCLTLFSCALDNEPVGEVTPDDEVFPSPSEEPSPEPSPSPSPESSPTLQPIEWQTYAEIISAYADFEQSGRWLYDVDTIYELLPEYFDLLKWTYWGEDASLVYSLYDINGDGVPELIVGINGLYDLSIHEIYAMQNGKPVLVAATNGVTVQLNLLSDCFGKAVMETSWGRMDVSEHFFYTLDENGKLVTLDKLYTMGFDRSLVDENGEFTAYILFRYKDVDGEQVSITEKEYTALIDYYGSQGYGIDSEAGFRLDAREGRFVELEWKSVSVGFQE